MTSGYIPTVVQVYPREGYRVVVYFDDGKIVEKDMTPLLDKPVFRALRDPDTFAGACCAENGTLAWDLDGTRDPSKAIDLDPCGLHDLPSVNGAWANEGILCSITIHYGAQATCHSYLPPRD